MHKGYGSCLVCESVCLCVCVCVCVNPSVCALAAPAYVYTAKQQYSQIIVHCSYRNSMHKYTSGCMHLHQTEMGGVSLVSDWSQFSKYLHESRGARQVHNKQSNTNQDNTFFKGKRSCPGWDSNPRHSAF